MVLQQLSLYAYISMITGEIIITASKLDFIHDTKIVESLFIILATLSNLNNSIKTNKHLIYRV